MRSVCLDDDLVRDCSGVGDRPGEIGGALCYLIVPSTWRRGRGAGGRKRAGGGGGTRCVKCAAPPPLVTTLVL